MLYHCTTSIYSAGVGQLAFTIRRIIIFGGSSHGIDLQHGADIDDAGHVIESSRIVTRDRCISISNIGGCTIRNLFAFNAAYALRVSSAPTAGQTVWATNSIFASIDIALRGTAVGQVTEDYNTLFGNGTDRNNVTAGANSIAYVPLLQPPILYAGIDQLEGFRFPPPLLGELSEWSQ
ncbi:MAG: hypothetical protein GY869_32715, partial [Planctomycetes bacterium]|nr:hypothetical protein [Planctomycetota bacterium]